MSKYHLEILVYKDGNPAQDYKVNAQGTRGFTKDVQTDSHGRAIVMTERQGTYTVYFDGSKRGYYQSPRQAIVYL